jgi:hypothetical protein
MMKLFDKMKRGQMGQVTTLVIGIVVTAAVLILGFILLGGMQTTAVSVVGNTSLGNTTVGIGGSNVGTTLNTSVTSVNTLLSSVPGWLTILFVAMIFVIILGFLLMLGSRNSGRG